MMNPKTTTIKTRKRQAGLTLLELTVVLLVLIGLSGLILPYAQGYLQRTHDSTGTDNLWELNNAIGLFQTKYMEYPDGFHTLVEGKTGTVYGNLMNTNIVAAHATNMKERMSLTMAGINKVWTMKDDVNSNSATFDAVSALETITKTTTISLAIVTKADIDGDGTYSDSVADHLAFAFYNNTGNSSAFDTTCYNYYVFGVGPENEMINHVMADAPLHFASQGGMGPEHKYNRFVAVFRVQKATDTDVAGCPESVKPAKLVGSAMLMMPGHLWGLAHTHAHTWENMAGKDN